MSKLIIIFLLTCSIAVAAPDSAPDPAPAGSPRPNTLWYTRDAGTDWMKALPLGNGRLGAMVFGGVRSEHLLLNESSLWSGWAAKDNDRPGASAALAKVRALIRDGKYEEAGKMAVADFQTPRGYGKADFGAYQSFCDAHFAFDGLPADPGTITGYQRDLNLDTGMASVRFIAGGCRFEREYFASHPGQLVAARFTASETGRISFRLTLASLHKQTKVIVEGNRILLRGQVDNGKGNPAGMKFEALLAIDAEGGNVRVEKNALVVEKADAATVRIVGATNYKLAYPDYLGEDPAVTNPQTLAAVAKKSFAELKTTHIADHAALFGRVSLDLGGDKALLALPTDERIARYKKSRDDRGLESLMFQFGRYLLIACSRPGGLPANLQGLWNNSNSPAWNCDYHLNINLQMNYWPAHNCNLSECALPLAAWLTDLRAPGEKTARIHYGTGGWVAHHTANVWGFTSPGSQRGVHMMEAESAAFICNNVWEYYAFTLDKEYLKKTAWPLLKGAAQFWIENLQELPDGRLTVSPAFSPEQGPLTGGAYYHIMIVHDLFTNCIAAGTALGGEDAFCAKLKSLRDRLPEPQIGHAGQLCEWLDPKLEVGVEKNHHRHVSHMYAIYPGTQISPAATPELAKAAIQSLNFRGDFATGWSAGWKINLWARLADGDRAWKLSSALISHFAAPNLFDLHPPFQIDGNFGYTAGVAEMLVQSHGDTIELLPALPGVWPDGKVSGLCARGGVSIDFEWKDRQITTCQLHAKNPVPIKVRINGVVKEMVAR